jgi:MFS family permease
VNVLRQRISASVEALADVVKTPALRRVQLAWVGSILGSWSYTIALGVYAYREGGATAVGIVSIVMLLPAAVAAPFLSTLADRFRRERVMIVSDVVRAGLMVVAGLVIAADGPPAVVYTLVGVSAVAGTVFRPAQAALLPSLVRTPQELTAANVVSSTLESVGSFIGPALGGLLLAFTNVQVVFFVNALSFVWSAAVVLAIRTERPQHVEPEARPSFVAETTVGATTIAREPKLRLLTGLYAAQTLVAGALSVFTVSMALGLLDIGASGVGWLTAALGAGSLVGGLAALGLAQRRLAGAFALGVVLFGLPLVLVAAWPTVPMAVVAMTLVGVGNSVTDVSVITLLQRAVPDAVLARVLGVVESMLLGTMGLGALLAPALIGLGSVRAAMLVIGAFLPVLVALSWRGLRRIDAEAAAPIHVDILARVPLFAPLPMSTLERLASQLEEVSLPAGSVVLQEGDPGDRFYVIAEGDVEIMGRRHGPGDFFGEIALLRDVPRTATVRALTDVRLLTLDRDEFLAAVTGHEPSAAAADAVVTARLGSLRPELASV